VVSLSAVRVLQGFAGAAISVNAMATVRDLFVGVAAARLMSRLMLVIGAAPVLAPSLGGIILQYTSWRGIFVVLAAFGLVLVLLAALGLHETLPPHRRRSARPLATLRTYRSLLRDPTFLALVFVAGLMMSTLFSYISGSSFVLQGVYGLDEQTFGIVFGSNALGLVLGTQLNPLLLRRFRPSRVLTFGVVTATVAAATMVLTAATGWRWWWRPAAWRCPTHRHWRCRGTGRRPAPPLRCSARCSSAWVPWPHRSWACSAPVRRCRWRR
jgi:MFS transporter, DHA1 family, multidrug resistance protein